MDFGHLFDLIKRRVCWVTRAKDYMQFEVVKRRLWRRKGKILHDDLIAVKTKKTRREYPEMLRRLVALVELDGKEVEMVLLTNNLEWSANTVVEMYRCRWAIEVFLKQMKQTLQLGDFLGHRANAVRWQVWMALLTYVLLRFVACLTEWEQSFGRLWTMIRAALWKRMDLLGLLKGYGTAGGHF